MLLPVTVTAMLAVVAACFVNQAMPDHSAVNAVGYDKGSTDADVLSPERRLPEEEAIFFPPVVGEMLLAGMIKGEKVTPVMAGILGAEYDIMDTYVACYTGSKARLVFWVMEFWNEDEACAVLQQMNHRISASASFTDHEHYGNELAFNYLHYARFTGGKEFLEHHFYYRKENRLYWVSLNGEDPLELIRPFLHRF